MDWLQSVCLFPGQINAVHCIVWNVAALKVRELLPPPASYKLRLSQPGRPSSNHAFPAKDLIVWLLFPFRRPVPARTAGVVGISYPPVKGSRSGVALEHREQDFGDLVGEAKEVQR